MRHLVDRERQRVGRQTVAETRQRIDHRSAVRLVMQQYDGVLAAGFAIGRQQGAHPAHQLIGWRHGIGGGAGGTDGGALAAARAQMRIDRHMIAGWTDGAGRA